MGERTLNWARSGLVASLAMTVEDLAGVWERRKKGRRLRFPSRRVQNRLKLQAEPKKWQVKIWPALGEGY